MKKTFVRPAVEIDYFVKGNVILSSADDVVGHDMYDDDNLFEGGVL